jgi:NADH:ubiquinone oxidoreductase subunit 2 (subunit N)
MFYYLAIARTMWMDEPTETEPLRPGLALGAAVAVLAFLAVLGGVLPGPSRAARTCRRSWPPSAVADAARP